MKNEIVVLIPAYNPTDDLIPLVSELLQNNFTIVVVNDGSAKRTKYIFDKLDKDRIIFLEHCENKGKGQALKTGFDYIKNNIECTGVVTADADGQHDLEDIKKVSNALKDTPNTLVLGSRLDTKSMPFSSRTGNTITRFVFKFATHTKVFDTQTGLRGIPLTMLDEFLNIPGKRYEYEINMLLYAAKHNLRIKEVGIKAIYLNDNKSSSFHLFRDSAQIYKCIFKYSDLGTTLLYGISAILAFIIDFTLLFIIKNITKPLFNEYISLLISVIGARAISSIFNFLVNRNIVFKSKKTFLCSLIEYYGLVIFSIIANYLLLSLLTNILNFKLFISKIIVEIVLFIFNYLVQKLYIFKKQEKTEI